MAETARGPTLERADDHPRTLLDALRRARREHGGALSIVRDGEDEPLTYTRLLEGAYALAGRLEGRVRPGARLGVLLPTGTPALVTLLAVHAAGAVPVLLNYSADATTVARACEVAQLRCVLSSRRFLRLARLAEIAAEVERRAEMLDLEDLRQELSRGDKALAALRARLPFLARDAAAPDDPAAILFTSGTTGDPKGVALSHANVLANIEQVRQHIPFDPARVFFNAMPMFHSLGLVGGTLLPVLGGMTTVLHPSPLDKQRIPAAIARTGANVLVSTDTFARLYARSAGADDLRGLRYVVLGGERVRDRTRAFLAEKTDAAVVEGYGVTECGPVVALNQPEANRPGTVGRLLPGIEIRLEEVPDIDVGRRLLVRGPNVMLGYLDPERDGALVPRGDDWFDTGDLVELDDDGFLRLTGRVKRFAKIGAEMVSLEAVEDQADRLWPKAHHAAVVVEGANDGGEQIVLVTDQADATRGAYAAGRGEAAGAPAAVPHHVLVVDEVPLLATGAPRYEAVRRVARERLSGGTERDARAN
jgi:acyl-[acyl-carrier-protein]-phospholipid O-acyltransferase/long-chain-fatty-acid--[acyl-carrier-protein] ligase